MRREPVPLEDCALSFFFFRPALKPPSDLPIVETWRGGGGGAGATGGGGGGGAGGSGAGAGGGVGVGAGLFPPPKHMSFTP